MRKGMFGKLAVQNIRNNRSRKGPPAERTMPVCDLALGDVCVSGVTVMLSCL